ncbi:uncharacterized protein LOC129295539 [Prosopis cineraria]|uniref:uncharacterized protein LOC129295539 n=1 Tax=Prosopis cineraria TaxID=364024 RepID=UPI002410AE20|nr:uncharacterized protein LOC129295539 [Prosopis cineraria]
MSADNICSWCNSTVESSLHVLRDCTDTGQLWGSVINTRYQRDFFNLRTIDDWISWNLKQGKKLEFQMNNGLFMVLCWNIWKRRNERIFEGKSRFNECIIAQAKGMMSCLERVQTKTSSINWYGNGIQNCDLRWKPSETSWVSLCVDGAFSMTMIRRAWEIRICQISRDANVAADHLAKQALDAWLGLHILSFPMESLGRCMDNTYTVNESRV